MLLSLTANTTVSQNLTFKNIFTRIFYAKKETIQSTFYKPELQRVSSKTREENDLKTSLR